MMPVLASSLFLLVNRVARNLVKNKIVKKKGKNHSSSPLACLIPELVMLTSWDSQFSIPDGGKPRYAIVSPLCSSLMDRDSLPRVPVFLVPQWEMCFERFQLFRSDTSNSKFTVLSETLSFFRCSFVPLCLVRWYVGKIDGFAEWNPRDVGVKEHRLILSDVAVATATTGCSRPQSLSFSVNGIPLEGMMHGHD